MNAKINILVVEDETDVEPMFRKKFRKEIKAKKINFHFALSATEALAYLDSAEICPDNTLILSDINMPEMNGLELPKKIKKKYANLAMFMVTAYGDEQTQKTAINYGANGFIEKPVNFTQLDQDIFAVASNCV